jgi:hypothetical protein
MKTKSVTRNLFKLLVPVFAFMLLALQPVFAIGGNGDNPGEKGKGAKKGKNATSRNNNSVKIYPDALKRIMHVVAKENEGKDVDFYVFDMQGTLVLNYKMKSGDHQRITGLSRGSYEYRVFNGDEETANGKFLIK